MYLDKYQDFSTDDYIPPLLSNDFHTVSYLFLKYKGFVRDQKNTLKKKVVEFKLHHLLLENL